MSNGEPFVEEHPILGQIKVYREYQPVRDGVDYTVYFLKDGKKCRLSAWLDVNEIDKESIEDYVNNKITQLVNDGYYEEQVEGVYKMHESKPDNQFPNEQFEVDDVPVSSGEAAGSPSDTELATLTMLMRLYDLGMALLTLKDETLAGEIYDLHAQGGHQNPQIFIPGPAEES